MKFIVDAQLPFAVVKWLRHKGFDALHTSELTSQNLTTDIVIIQLSVSEQRVVISKDKDFWEYFVLHQKPYKLLLLTVGNFPNHLLIDLLEKNFEQIQTALQTHRVLELSKEKIVIRY